MKRLGLAALSAALLCGAAYAAGYFPGFPIVGSSSYCSSNITAGVPGTSSVCGSTTPAGPTALTGSEVFPADTGLASGVQPQTVLVPAAALNALPWAYETHPTTSSSTVVSNSIGGLFITTAAGAAKAGFSMQFPSSPLDNQRLTLATNVSLTGIGLTPNTGQSLAANVISSAGGTLSPTWVTTTAGLPSYEFLYRLADTTWRRIR